MPEKISRIFGEIEDTFRFSDNGHLIARFRASDISLKAWVMRRRLFLLLIIVLLVTGSATGVHASTDCQRWFIAYKNELAQSQAAKRLRAAKARARRYARMKLAGYVKPKPVAKPHHRRRPAPGPRMTKAELLRRLDLACGVLPEREADHPILKEETIADFLPHLPLSYVPLVPSEDEPLLAYNEPPTLPGADRPVPSGPGFIPPPGGPGFFLPPVLPPPPSTPPVTPVPEPESLVLLLTGLAGGAAMVRRKIQASRS
jgi:hypothetical protein